MCSFYKYYSGEAIAPLLTVFIGGNHEASNYLQVNSVPKRIYIYVLVSYRIKIKLSAAYKMCSRLPNSKNFALVCANIFFCDYFFKLLLLGKVK